MAGFLGGMAGGATVSIVIQAVDKYSKAIKDVNTQLGGLSGVVQKHAVAIGVAGAAITAFGVAGVAVGKSLVDSASNAQEIFTKFDAVFENVSSKAEETAKSIKDNYGLATSSAKELLSSTGDLLTGFGMQDEAALDMSKTITELAVDLASFQNLQGGAAQAVHIMNRAILGERESLTTLGVKILEVDVQQELLRMGAENLTGTELLQAKAFATLNLIMKQTGKAQGDFARTQEGFANQSRILSERIKELKESLGTHLLPVATKIVGIVTQAVEWFNNLSEGTQKFIVIGGAVAAVLALVIGPLLMMVALLPAIAAGIGIITAVASPWLIIIVAAIALIAGLIAMSVMLYKKWDTMSTWLKVLTLLFFPLIGVGIMLIKNWDKIKETASETWNFVKIQWDSAVERAQTVTKAIGNFFIGMANIIRGAWNAVIEGIAIAINWMIDKINRVINLLNVIPGVNFRRLGDISLDFAKLNMLPTLAKGGVVTGPTLAMIGEKGPEAVIPLSRGGVGMVTINIENINGLTGKDIAERLQEELNTKIMLN